MHMHACASPSYAKRLGGAHAQYMHSTQYAFLNGIEIGSKIEVSVCGVCLTYDDKDDSEALTG